MPGLRFTCEEVMRIMDEVRKSGSSTELAQMQHIVKRMGTQPSIGSGSLDDPFINLLVKYQKAPQPAA